MLAMVVSVFQFPVSADTVDNMIANGSFEGEGGSSWRFENFTSFDYESARKLGNAADGDYYLDLKDQRGDLVQTISNLSPYTRYEFSFKMKSSVEMIIQPHITFYGRNANGNDVVYNSENFSGVDPEYTAVYENIYAISNNAVYRLGENNTTDETRNAWTKVGFEIPVQSNLISKVIIRLKIATTYTSGSNTITVPTDPYLCVDDFVMKPIEGEFNYFPNGRFENNRGKTLIGVFNNVLNLAQQDGNNVLRMEGGVTSPALSAALYLRSGRYKLEFKAKLDTAGASTYLHLNPSPIKYAGTGTNYGIHNTSYATIKTPATSDWAKVAYHFTVPTDANGKEVMQTLFFALPSSRVGATSVKGGYYDDFKVTRDHDSISFSKTTLSALTNGGRPVYYQDEVTSISAAIAQGLNKINVSATVLPQAADGTSENAKLLVALYKTVNNNKKLESITVTDGATVETDVTMGGGACGIINLSGSIDLPSQPGLDNTYTVEAFLWRRLEGITPIREKALLTY